jgi:hypothetical protein
LNLRNYIIPTLAILCAIVLLVADPIPQRQDYHHFADERNLLGIPNFLNVITNLPFFLVGIAGILEVRRLKEKELKHIFRTLFSAFLLLAIGSGYYHWSPENITLVYDRIPIVIILMSFFAFIIYISISKSIGYKAFYSLSVVGILSVIYWIMTENAGVGDVRWYGMVQFFPVFAIPIILVLYGTPRVFRKQLLLIFIFFGLAKFAEMFDKQIYDVLGCTISGHPLKHLLMAWAGYQIVTIPGNLGDLKRIV